MSSLLMWSNPLTRWTGIFSIVPWEDLDFQLGFVKSTSRSIGRFGHGLKWLQGSSGVAWTGDGGIPQGCLLSIAFIVGLYAPWCRHWESLKGKSPQLYADLKCTS